MPLLMSAAEKPKKQKMKSPLFFAAVMLRERNDLREKPAGRRKRQALKEASANTAVLAAATASAFVNLTQ